MDVESLRSGRSEKSDRSRKLLHRMHMSAHPQGQQQIPIDMPPSNTVINRNHSVHQVSDQPMQPSDANLQSACSGNLHSSGPTQVYQPGAAPQNYPMYNWIPSMGVPVGPNFAGYPQNHPYSPTGWANKPMPPGYQQQQQQQQNMPSSQFNGMRFPMANQSQQQQTPETGQPIQSEPYGATGQVSLVPLSNQSNQINSAQQQAQLERYPSGRFENNQQQDENAWVEEATAVTGATSETGLSGGDNFSRFGARYGLANSLGMQNTAGGSCNISGATAALIRTETDDVAPFTCSHVAGNLASTVVGMGALLSPILMLLLPHTPSSVGWPTDPCKPACEGHLIGISVKLVLLALATFAISAPCRLFRPSEATIYPRIHLCRTLFLCLVSVVLFAFWLFYTVRVMQPRETAYLSIVLFAGSLTDTLLLLYYAGIGMMELRKIRQRYVIHVVRSPDGASKTLTCGEMSLQRAALEVLHFYMVNFTAYTPGQCISPNGNTTTNNNNGKRGRRGGYNANHDSGSAGGSKFKFYDVDGGGATTAVSGSEKGNSGFGNQAAAGGGGPIPSASARLYEELELEKRTRKRRMRLLVAVEEAFAHVKRLAASDAAGDGAGSTPFNNSRDTNAISFKDRRPSSKSLDPFEAAQAVFPTLIRPLQKYMRITRQQARHPVDTVIDHLALCLAYGLSPHAFLERFNPVAVTPQQDAATAASAVIAVKRDKKQQQQQLPDCNSNGKSQSAGTDLLLPKRICAGGQQSWSIVADRALSRGLSDGAIFQLRRGSEVSLLCTVRRLPLIRLAEEVLEPLGAGRFALHTDGAV